MNRFFIRTAALASLAFAALPCSAQPYTAIALRPVGQLNTGAAAEIVAYDAPSRQLFVINGTSGGLDVVSLAQPWAPQLVRSISLSTFGGGANSVAIRNGIVAVAVQADPPQAPGRVVFFDSSGQVQSSVTVGALPDMLTFTPDGTKVVVANEGEPNGYCEAGPANDPEGTISIIDLSGGVANLTDANVRTAGFAAWNGGAPEGVRIFGPGATVAQDLEPEYITVSADSQTAWVTLQENNALATVNLATGTVTALTALGTKDHNSSENALDSSDRDDTVRIVPHPVSGFFMPDAVASYRYQGQTYLVTANEGDARDYDCFSEEERVGDLELDPTVFPNAEALQDDAELGRLRTTNANGDTDGDGDVDVIYSFGARSFTLWNTAGECIWDSGKELELLTATSLPAAFNSNGSGTNSLDSRSDDKGPEPEGVVVGNIRGRNYAFVGLERTSAVAVYDITEPQRPFFVQLAANVHADGTPIVGTTLDQGPEGLIYIPREDSPTGRALLVVAHEVSGTLTVYSILPR